MSVGCSVNGRNIIVGEPELHLSLGARTIGQARSQGFYKFSATDQIAMEVETDLKKKFRACRGVKQLVKTSNRRFDMKYTTTLGNLGASEASLLYHGQAGGDNARQALNNIEGSLFNFDTSADGQAYQPGRWMEILDASGRRVRGIDALLIAGGNASYGPGEDDTSLIEGVDYEVDRKLGMVSFRREIDDDVLTPTITAPPIQSGDASYLRKMKPGSRFTHRGVGHLFIFDDDEEDNLALRHEGFVFEMVATSSPTFGDDEFATFDVDLHILNPQSSELYARPDIDLWGNVAG